MRSMDHSELLRTVASCFNDCQQATASHNRCTQSLRKLYLQDPDRVADAIARMVFKVLRVSKKESNVERVVKFVGKLVRDITHAEDRLFQKKGRRISLESQFTQQLTPMPSAAVEAPENESDVEQSFRYSLLRFLLRFTEVEDKAVRWRSCQLIGAICGSIAGANMIGPSLKSDMVGKLLPRTQDRIPQIRCCAIRALSFILDADLEADKPIVKEFKRLMDKDSHQEVRKAAVQCFPVSGDSLNRLLKRTRDVNPDVRKTAFRSLASSSPLLFGTDQLAETLVSGLRDRDTKVQKACLDMLRKWIVDIPLQSILELLDVTAHETTAEIVISKLLAVQDDLESLNVVSPFIESFASFTQEMAIVWRVSLEPEHGQIVEPSVGLEDMIQLVETAVEGNPFILKQLLMASSSMISLSSEHFRREFSRCLRSLLLEQSDLEIVAQQLCVDALAKIHSHEGEFLQIMLEILADIVEPLDNEEDEDEEDEDLLGSQEVSIATRSSEVHIRALVLVEKILCNTTLTANHPGIAGLLQAIIIPAVQHRHIEVRSMGLKSFGLYCLLDMDMAASNLLLFVQAANRDKDVVKIVAAQTLFDFLSKYNPIELLKQEEDWPSEFKTDVLSQAGERGIQDDEDAADRRSFTVLTLVKFLRHNDGRLRTVAVEGFAKLLLNNFITDPQILSILVTLYFHPATESSSDLVQCLGTFFPAYSIGGEQHQICLEDCFMPTIRRILTSSRYSPLRKVPVDKVATFLLQHLSTSLEKTKSVHHDRLLVELAEEVFAMGAYVSEQGKLLCKVICKQAVCGEDLQLVHRLTTATIQLARKSNDKNLQRSLQSVYKKLSALCPGGAGTKRLLPVEELTTKKKRREGDKGERTTNVLQPLQVEEDVDSNIPEDSPARLGKRKAASTSTRKTKQNKNRSMPTLHLREEQPLEVADLETSEIRRRPPTKDVILAFTGFTEQDPAYNFVNLKKLVANAKALGARVILGNVIDPCITHMVAPPKRRTLKTLIASLAKKWVIDPAWITKSMDAGEFLPEAQFGSKLQDLPFRRKTVHISTQFMEENPNRQFTLSVFKTLIADLGGGQLVRVPKGADMVLCGKAMKIRHRKDARYLDWKDWFALIQPDGA